MTDIAHLGIVVDGVVGIEKAATSLDHLASSGRRAEVAASTFGRQLGTASNRAHTYATQANKATIHTTNLAAQFNDIAVMMVSGQNPFMLAMQQGTQINQVFQQMGGGANIVKAIGASLRSVINPLSIMTIGIIALGGAFVQWLTKAGEKTKTLSENIDDMQAALKGMQQASEEASYSLSDMLKNFGTADPILKAVLVDMAALAKIDAFKAVDDTANSVERLITDLAFWDERSSASASQDFLGLTGISSKARDIGVEFARNLEILADAKDPAEKLAAALDLREVLFQNVGGYEDLNAEQKEFVNGLSMVIRDLTVMGVTIKRAGDEYRQYAATRLEGDRLSQQQRLEDLKRASEINEELSQRLDIEALISAYGADSLEVFDMRALYARKEFEASLRTLNLTEEERKELLQVYRLTALMERTNWQNANNVEKTYKNTQVLAHALSVASGHAATLSQNLARAPFNAISLQDEAHVIQAGLDAVAKGYDRAGVSVAQFRAELEAKYGLSSAGSTAEEMYISSLINKEVELYAANQAANQSLQDQLALMDDTGASAAKLTKELTEAEVAANNFADTMSDQITNAVRGASDVIAGMLTGMYENFGDAAKAMLNVFRQMLANMISMALQNKIMLSLGMGGVAGPAAASGIGGIGSGVGSALLGTMGTGLFSAAPVFGTGLAGGLGATLSTSFGAGGSLGNLFAVGANAGLAGGGVMATIGAALPLIGIAVALFSLFKKKPIISAKDFNAIQAGLEVAGVELLNTGTSGQKAALHLKNLAGGIDEFTNKTQAYYDRFFTDEEKLKRTTDYINSVFASMNIGTPTDKMGFRGIVEGLDLTTSAGREMFNTLMDIAPAFADVADASSNLQNQMSALSGNRGLFRTLQEELFASSNGSRMSMSDFRSLSDSSLGILTAILSAIRSGNINNARLLTDMIDVDRRTQLDPSV